MTTTVKISNAARSNGDSTEYGGERAAVAYGEDAYALIAAEVDRQDKTRNVAEQPEESVSSQQ